MQLGHKRFRLGVFGASGTGKTTYALRYVAHARTSCAFLFDADGEFSELMQLSVLLLPSAGCALMLNHE